MPQDPLRRLVIGAMTGTSIDALDLALLEVRGQGLSMGAAFRRGRTCELGEVAQRLRAAAAQEPRPAAFFAELALDLGRLHAREAAALAGADRIDLVVVHGQTIHHAPPASWQLINPFPIAATLHCEVLSDLRQADLVSGGRGAPITPLSDWILFRAPVPRVILNLGGFANATWLPGAEGGPDRIRGADLCVCNQLLDRAARCLLGAPFDRDGAAASAGRAHASERRELEQMLETQRLAGRSLGTGDEAFPWIERASRTLAPPDLLATAVEAIAAVLARGIEALASAVKEVVVAGGGVRNRALLAAISRLRPWPLRPTDSLGVPMQMREAAGMAVLGALACDGVPVSLPAVTGRLAMGLGDGLRCGPQPPVSSPRPRFPATAAGIATSATGSE